MASQVKEEALADLRAALITSVPCTDVNKHLHEMLQNVVNQMNDTQLIRYAAFRINELTQ